MKNLLFMEWDIFTIAPMILIGLGMFGFAFYIREQTKNN